MRKKEEMGSRPRRTTLIGLPKKLALLAGVLLLCAGVFLAPKAGADKGGIDKDSEEAAGRYAINLLSSTSPIEPSTLHRHEVFKKYQLYTTIYDKDGELWYRLRLGFFESKEAATEVLDDLRGDYKEAWVSRVSTREMKDSERLPLVSSAADNFKFDHFATGFPLPAATVRPDAQAATCAGFSRAPPQGVLTVTPKEPL